MSTNSKDRLEAYISGRVQGVGFRYFTTRKADQLGVSGWVRNENDGRVRLVAEGERAQLENLLDAVREGPSSARVTNVEATWEAPEEVFEGFGVRHS